MDIWCPGSSPYGVRARLVAIALVAALVVPVLGGFAAPRAAAQSDWDGEYVLQCSCPVWWWAPWEGEGTFDVDESLDEVILENGDATLLMHEIPALGNSVLDLVDRRTDELEASRRIDDLEEVSRIDGTTTAIVNRRWVDRSGELILSFQHVQEWESNFYLSVEFNAPEAQFLDLWESLEDVLLVGTPVLGEFSSQAVLEDLTRGLVVADLEVLGVVDETTYESPNFGYEVEFPRAWTIDTENSTTEATYDFIQFIGDEGWAVSVTGHEPASSSTIADYVDYLIDNEEDEYGSEILLEGAGADAGGYVAVYEADNGVQMAAYADVRAIDRGQTVVLVMLIAPVADFEEALAAAREEFTLDGEPVLDYFRTREIREALADV